MSKRKAFAIGCVIGLFIVCVYYFTYVENIFANEGREHDNVPGQECEQGEHTNNPHCQPTYSPTPSLTCTPEITITQGARVTPTDTPSVTPTESETPTPSPVPSASVTETPTNTPDPTGSVKSWEDEKKVVFPGEDKQYGPQK